MKRQLYEILPRGEPVQPDDMSMGGHWLRPVSEPQTDQAFALYKDVMEELKTVKADDLRDQFAMAALHGITSNTGIINGRIAEDIEWLTETCYAIADAMLKERGNAV